MEEEEYAAKKKEGLNDRITRMKDNKSTHYVVGYDPPQNETEQVCVLAFIYTAIEWGISDLELY